MVGNSLLDEFEGIKLFDEKLLDNDINVTLKMKQMSLFDKKESRDESILSEIKLLHKRFFKEKDSKEKKEIKKEIDKLEWELIQYTLTESGNENKIKELEKLQKEKRKPYFLWKLEFAEVFMEKGGFDIVIGNPPYVKYENLDENFKKEIKKYYTCAEGFFDLYQLFLERGFNLLKKAGVLIFIFPSLFLKGINYKESRRYFTEKSNIKIIRDYSDNVFTNVSMPTCVMLFERGQSEENLIRHISHNKENIIKYEFLQKEINLNSYIFSFNKICNKMKKNRNIINDFFNITRGLEIGKNKRKDHNKLLTENKSILFGDDIRKYEIKKISQISNEVYEEYKKNEEIFEQEKVIIRETGNEITSLFEDSKLITNRSLYCIRNKSNNSIDLKYLCSILNSKLIQYYYSNEYKSNTNIFPKIRITQVKQIPIIDAIIEKKNIIIGKLENIIEQKKQNMDTTDLENEIDEMVYDLYELTEEEKEIVRNFKS